MAQYSSSVAVPLNNYNAVDGRARGSGCLMNAGCHDACASKQFEDAQLEWPTVCSEAGNGFGNKSLDNKVCMAFVNSVADET